MNFVVKNFNELTKEELYEILRVRAQIFVAELKMNCQDLDGVDFEAFHFCLEEKGKIQAYLRAFYTDEKTIKIGRVLSIHHGKGLGADLMKKSLGFIKEHMPCKTVFVDSQKHAVGFYEKMGFKAVSDEFIEEGVLHIKMELNI